MRTAINASIFVHGKLLIVEKKQSWILPGGKPHIGESDEYCLKREIAEELSGTRIQNLRLYDEFEGETPHVGDILRARVYFADLDGCLHGPSAEIGDFAWLDYLHRDSYSLSPLTRKIVDSFYQRGHLV